MLHRRHLPRCGRKGCPDSQGRSSRHIGLIEYRGIRLILNRRAANFGAPSLIPWHRSAACVVADPRPWYVRETASGNPAFST